MRCKLSDAVMVIRGIASGYCGTVIAASDIDTCDWLVRFERPAPGFDGLGRLTEGREIHCCDCDLLPVNPPGDPVETETERELVA